MAPSPTLNNNKIWDLRILFIYFFKFLGSLDVFVTVEMRGKRDATKVPSWTRTEDIVVHGRHFKAHLGDPILTRLSGLLLMDTTCS